MRKLILTLTLVLLLVLSSAAAVFNTPLDRPEPVKIVAIKGADHHQSFARLHDGNTATGWTLPAKNSGTGRLEITLAEQVFVDYLEIAATGLKTADIQLCYRDSAGEWRPYIGWRQRSRFNGSFDLSGNLVPAKELRLIFNSTEQTATFNEIKIFGHQAEEPALLEGKVIVSGDAAASQAQFLTDHNTYTTWPAPVGPTAITYQLTETTPVKSVKLFNRGCNGTVTCYALVRQDWVLFGSPVNLSGKPAGWLSITGANTLTNTIKIELTSGTGLAEMEVWGQSSR